MGMFFNYFKVAARVFRPINDHPAEIARLVRSANQHSHAIAREFTTNAIKAKKELKPLVPDIEVDPFRNVGLQNEQPVRSPSSKLNGVSLIETSVLERRRIVERKLKANKREQIFYN